MMDVCGQGTSGFVDGAYDEAQFHSPSVLCLLTNGGGSGSCGDGAQSKRDDDAVHARKYSRAVLCVDSDNNRVRRIDLSDGLVCTLAGSGAAGFENGDALAGAAFNQPSSICADPVNLGCFFIGTHSS